eukprot:4315996-Amphidinium_carterae.4
MEVGNQLEGDTFVALATVEKHSGHMPNRGVPFLGPSGPPRKKPRFAARGPDPIDQPEEERDGPPLPRIERPSFRKLQKEQITERLRPIPLSLHNLVKVAKTHKGLQRTARPQATRDRPTYQPQAPVYQPS